MAMLKRKRCTVYCLLLFGSVFAFFSMFPWKNVKCEHLEISSVTFTNGFVCSRNDNQQLLLLQPVQDESRMVEDLQDYIRPSQTANNFLNRHLERKLPTENLTRLNAKSSVVTGPKSSIDTIDIKTFPDHNTQDNHVKIAQSSNREYENVYGSVEEHYFKAIKPKLKSMALRKNKVHILIVTNRRSGSSFLGQFFNQNPQTFFQFEPLKLTEWKKEFYPDMADYLHHLMKCEFDKMPYLLEFFNYESLHRASSKLMIEPPLCNASFKSPFSPSMVKKKCQPLKLIPLMQACRNKQSHAAKLIRLYNLSSLEPLAFDPEINLKIIHLVRDPRGTYLSRSKLKGTNISLKLGASLDSNISYLCRRINRNLEFIRSQPAWIQGKYKLIRYEDIAYHPEQLAQEIYDFTGMGQVPKEVVQWIQNNTKEITKPDKENQNIYYSTSRDASQVTEAWRYKVPLQVVLRMQDFCRETLRDLGYLEVKTEEELLNKSRSLVIAKH